MCASSADTQYVLGMRVVAPERVHQAVTCLKEAHTHTLDDASQPRKSGPNVENCLWSFGEVTGGDDLSD